MALSISHRPPPPTKPLDPSLRGYLATNADIVTRVTKPVHMADIGALSAQSDRPILFENIVEKPGFRLCDILVKNRRSQARALGTLPENYLRTLAYRLRQPPRGFKIVKSGPVKEVIKLHNEADWTELPIPYHKDKDDAPYVTAMNIIRDPETGFYNSCHAGTHAVGPRRGLISFVTPHSHVIMRKYRDMGMDAMPIAFVFGLPPAYEIMANFSGLHMDAWGEMEMVGTIMDRDIEMVRCETLELNVPAEAEIVVEARVNLKDRFKVGEGMVNDALMLAMGAPWLNTKLVVAVSPDTNLDDPGDVYHAIATRCDPARDVIVVANTRGSPYDPSARPLEGQYPWRIVGKMGIDATIKSRHDPADFERAWPRNWGQVKLSDYL